MYQLCIDFKLQLYFFPGTHVCELDLLVKKETLRHQVCLKALRHQGHGILFNVVLINANGVIFWISQSIKYFIYRLHSLVSLELKRPYDRHLARDRNRSLQSNYADTIRAASWDATVSTPVFWCRGRRATAHAGDLTMVTHLYRCDALRHCRAQLKHHQASIPEILQGRIPSEIHKSWHPLGRFVHGSSHRVTHLMFTAVR